jgi:Ca2+-dependent lipid-binding protein
MVQMMLLLSVTMSLYTSREKEVSKSAKTLVKHKFIDMLCSCQAETF